MTLRHSFELLFWSLRRPDLAGVHVSDRVETSDAWLDQGRIFAHFGWSKVLTTIAGPVETAVQRWNVSVVSAAVSLLVLVAAAHVVVVALLRLIHVSGV